MDHPLDLNVDHLVNVFIPLSAFPEDVLAHTTRFLSGYDISQLLCIGDRLLSAKLMQGGLFDVICLGEPILKMLKPATGVKRLEIHSPTFEASLWLQLPLSLNHLYLSVPNGVYKPESSYCAPNIEFISMQSPFIAQNPLSWKSCFPNLKYLEFRDSSYIKLLKNPLSDLPSGFHTLSTPESIFDIQILSLLPSSLTSLNFQLGLLDSEISKLLPASLTHLTLNVSSDIDDPSTFDFFPISLESLVLSGSVTFNAPNFSYLPSSLTELSMTAKNTQEGKRFPPKLYRLSLGEHIMTNSSLMELPSSIRYLEFNASAITEAGLRNLPSNLEFLHFRSDPHFTNSIVQYLPSNLQSFSSTSQRYTNDMIPLLPRHLTSLELPSALKLSNGCVKDFPRTLTNLNLSRAYELNGNCLVDMPPYLTRLDLYGNIIVKWRRLTEIPLTSASCLVTLNGSSFTVQKDMVAPYRTRR